ncbi:hypothetical protein RDV89_20085 [Nocardioides zeae]|uniref:Uncharacterized protein n=1 Tax=Nocardioides imazamoxiresistens TaxID=3231893 RepID=A0ABU3Q1W9_9ACTN|nr:hypothetical protein [Nocardioides zeae]MDT9595394.1 hypothetical protein [Nocardioides zeae]
MFVHHCTVCDTAQLTFDTQITGVRPVPGGYEATFTCWCGGEQTFLSEGAAAAALELAA